MLALKMFLPLLVLRMSNPFRDFLSSTEYYRWMLVVLSFWCECCATLWCKPPRKLLLFFSQFLEMQQKCSYTTFKKISLVYQLWWQQLPFSGPKMCVFRLFYFILRKEVHLKSSEESCLGFQLSADNCSEATEPLAASLVCVQLNRSILTSVPLWSFLSMLGMAHHVEVNKNMLEMLSLKLTN